MAKMGSRKHLKRFKSPKHWPIPPKESKWTVKPSPGPHGMENSLPLLIIVRDILKVADTSREAKKIINSGEILIDGQPRKNYKFPVGFMDVVEIPRTGKTYRVGLSEKGELTLYPIKEEDKSFKLCKIINKTTLKGGKTQLNFHDGRNHITNENFKVGDVIKLKIPQQDIIDSISFKEGNIGLVTGGKHIGEIGKIKKITITRSSMPNTVIIETEDNKNFMTLKDYVFIIGEKEPAIQIGGKP